MAVTLASSGGCKDRTSVPGAPPPPKLSAAVRPASPRLADPLWSAARDGDPLELAALADREGAVGLLEALDDGGEIARTALGAFAFAADGELAYGRLGQIAQQVPAEEADSVLDALLALASRKEPDTEPLDRAGLRACGAALLDVARRKGAPPKTRARAVSVLRRLADRRAVDPGAIPTELDAK